jgi:hypothetical protein
MGRLTRGLVRLNLCSSQYEVKRALVRRTSPRAKRTISLSQSRHWKDLKQLTEQIAILKITRLLCSPLNAPASPASKLRDEISYETCGPIIGVRGVLCRS